MKRLATLTLSTFIAASSASNTSALDWAGHGGDRQQKISDVLEAMPELGKLAARSYQIGMMCKSRGHNSMQKFEDDAFGNVDPTESIDIMQCCTVFHHTAFAYGMGRLTKFVDFFTPPSRKLNKSAEQYAKMAEKIATKAVDKSAGDLVDNIIAQTRHDWENTWSLCQRPLKSFTPR
ncbi:hypothetical protein [Methylobacterium sp. Leaf89]|uniref:hypothetical protein n=1 Tax=Methylobacterium sp. Leaf89 TaxID=1736245 RepID=UPI0012E84913|nr:hypothetical protein [Methylobacterium sp. Leaf89]